MKSLFKMKGTERAAALLVILGRDAAADIMKHLDDDSIEKLSAEMVRINRLSAFEKEELFGEFMLELKGIQTNNSGGMNRAKELISNAFGKEKAEELISKISRKEPSVDFSYLNDADPSLLLSVLGSEEVHVIALVLMFLKPTISGQLLKLLPREKAKAVGIRMAKGDRPSNEVACAVAKKIKERYMALENEISFEGEGGVDSLVNIFSHMTSAQESRLLGELDQRRPELSKKIKDVIFVFENISNLSNGDMRILIDEINNDELVSYALKGAGDDIRFKFLRNMSQNRATDILEAMDIMGPVRIEEIEYARGVITDIMKDLSDNGVIVIRRDGEIYVD